MREFRVVGYALQFIRNDLLHFRFDAVVVLLYLLLHPVQMDSLLEYPRWDMVA